MKLNFFFFFIITISLYSCFNTNEANDKLVGTYDAKTRAAWQKPEIVIDKLGDLKDKVIADIGAGTGYFSFRFAMKAKKVIAVDIDRDMLELMNLFVVNLPKDIQSKFETRLAENDDPKLIKDEIDIVVVINTFSYIKDKNKYLEILKKGLKKEGKIMILNFKLENISPESPPVSDRISLENMTKSLISTGYKIEESDNTSLEHQYVIIATL